MEDQLRRGCPDARHPGFSLCHPGACVQDGDCSGVRAWGEGPEGVRALFFARSSPDELISFYPISRIARDKSANPPGPVCGRPTDTGRKRLEVSVMRVE